MEAHLEPNFSSDCPVSGTGQTIEGIKDLDQIFIARQPIFDSTEKVIGYQLLPQQIQNAPEITPPNGLRASAHLLDNAFNHFGLQQILGDRLAFIPISSEALASDILELLPPEKVVLDIRPSDLNTDVLIGIVSKLHDMHFRFSLSNFTYTQALSPLFALASYVTHDVHQSSMDSIQDQIQLLQHLQIKHIATNLQSYEDFQLHKKGMFSLYQGHKFAPYDSLSMNRLDTSTFRVMQLFNLVMSQADFNVIEDHFKHDVALSYSLLCYLNSAGYGMPFKVESIRSALMLLGYNFLGRWLSLLIFAGADVRAGQRVLLNTALIRGRLMELLGAKTLSQQDGDKLFITGIFSMLDTFLGTPLNKALENLNLPDEVNEALILQQGKYAPLLALSLAFEATTPQQLDTLCKEVNITPKDATAAHLAAIEWARKLS